MSGYFLLFPFIVIRFLLLYTLEREAPKRAGKFAPIYGKEWIAYSVYQLSTLGIVIYLFLLSYQTDLSLYYVMSTMVYSSGLVLLSGSTLHFAFPSSKGLNTRRFYRWTRHPMYVSYFVYFIGCALLTRSVLLFCIVMTFQLSAHWIILSEERWCIEQFGSEYIEYMKKVRRYV